MLKSDNKRQVVMHIEGIPNPHAIKFVLENGILTDRPYEFHHISQTKQSPLAAKLMMYRYVKRVLINRNYLTVLKDVIDSPSWNQIIPELRQLIQDHLSNNEPILYVGTQTLSHEDTNDAVIEIVQQVLDKRIRPAAQEDGGDILIESYKDGVLNLSMHGACFTCPYASNTLKDGVEALLSQMVPEIKKVTATDNGVH